MLTVWLFGSDFFKRGRIVHFYSYDINQQRDRFEKLFFLKQNQGSQWMKSSTARVHSHDVRALALLESKDILVSGGEYLLIEKLFECQNSYQAANKPNNKLQLARKQTS